MIKVDIFVEGGSIEDLESDHDLAVRIFDYDIDDIDEHDIGVDDAGNRCVISEFEVSGSGRTANVEWLKNLKNKR